MFKVATISFLNQFIFAFPIQSTGAWEWVFFVFSENAINSIKWVLSSQPIKRENNSFVVKTLLKCLK